VTQAAATAAAPTTSTTTSSTSTTPAVSTPKPPSPLSKKPAVTVPTGPAPKQLVVKDLIKGTGAVAKKGSNLTVNYVGVLYKGGKEFDSSWKRSQTFPFVLGQGSVIPGWDQGLVGMKVGGRRELIIPSSLAYGPRGSGAAIPPNSPLVFVVDLLGAS
jgi:peptidylprolyl isomerase